MAADRIGKLRAQKRDDDLDQRLYRSIPRRTVLVMNQNVVGWIGMSATLAGVAIQSLLPELTRYSFLIFLAAALLWFFNGALTRNRPLMYTQVVLIVLNSVAVYRWFAIT
jgi:hypothetical protein